MHARFYFMDGEFRALEFDSVTTIDEVIVSYRNNGHFTLMCDHLVEYSENLKQCIVFI